MTTRSTQPLMPPAKAFLRLAIHLALVLLILAGCGKRGIEKAQQHPITQLPSGATAVGVLNFRLLRQHPDFPKYEKEMESDLQARARLEKFKAKTGTDLLHDTDRVAFGVYGDEADFNFLGIILGKFDESKIVAAIKEEAPETNLEAKKFANLNYYVISDPQLRRQKTLAFSFPTPRMVLFATEEDLFLRGLDTLGGKSPAMETDANFKSLLKESDSESTLWVVGLIPETLRDKLYGTMAGDLAVVEKYSVRLRWLADLSLDIRLTTKTEADAGTLHSALLGAKGMASMVMHSQSNGAGNVLEKLTLRSEKSDVFISLQLTAQEVDALLAERRPSPRGEGTTDTLTLRRP